MGIKERIVSENFEVRSLLKIGFEQFLSLKKNSFYSLVESIPKKVS